MKKRFLAMFLTLVMCLALMPTAALAASSDFEMDGTVLKEYIGPGGAVTIPDGTTGIREGAFFDCTGLTSVTIPNSVTSIWETAFSGCTSLTSVTIPNSVTEIGKGAFIGCTSLTAIQVDDGNPCYTSVDGVLFTKDMKTIVAYPGGKKGAYAIPDSVTEIWDSAFDSSTGLASVTIPNSVTEIWPYAFCGCTGLTSVTIPNSVKAIKIGVFAGCTGLTSMTIPNGVVVIWDDAFMACTGLTSVTIPNSVTEIGKDVFAFCDSLKDVYYSGTEAQWKAIDIDNGDNGGKALLLSATIHYNSTMPTTPDKPAAPATAPADPTNDKLTVNGVEATPAAYKIDGANYFKLRDVAALLNGTKSQFNVDWDGATQSAVITPGQSYTRLPTDLQGKPTASATANLSKDVIYINGKKAELTIYKIGNSNYIKLRNLGSILDFALDYQNGTVVIDTTKPYTE